MMLQIVFRVPLRVSALSRPLPILLTTFLFTMTIHAETPVTITVGPSNADFIGSDSSSLQKAADELSRRAPSGNGILLIQPATYSMHDSLHIRTPMTIRGSGPATILK